MSDTPENEMGETGEFAARNSLQILIRERRRSEGLSYSDIATRGGLSRSTVYYLASADQLHRSPSAATLGKLARGLGLPVDIVRRAVAEAVGLHIHAEPESERDPSLDVLIVGLEKLSSQQRRHVAALVRSLLADD